MTELIPYLSIPVMLFLSVLFHELGHIVAGLLTRHRNTELAVQGIYLTKTDEGWRWRFNGWHMGGHVMSHLVGLDNYRNRLLVVIVGGPVVNILMIAVSVAFLARTDSPYLRVWIFVNMWDLCYSFMNDLENDYLHVRQALGKEKGSKRFLASHVLYSEGVDPAEKQRLLTELGFPEFMLARRYRELVEAGKHEDAARTIGDLLTVLDPKRERTRVFYECEAAFRFAYRRLDVGKAVRLLPPETRAQVYDCEDDWLRAATMVAMAEARWKDARDLARRALAKEDADLDRKWLEMADKSADRHLDLRSRAKA